MQPRIRVVSILIGALSVPLSLWAGISATNAISAHSAYVSCLESINLDGIDSPAKVCRDRKH